MNLPNPASLTIRPRRRVAGRRNAGRVPRSRSVIAVAAIATVLIVWVFGAAHCGLLQSGSAPPRLPQPVLTSPASPLAATGDQPHLDHRSASLCHKTSTIAVQPQSSSSAVAPPGVVVALLAATGWRTPPVVAAGRGPPRAAAAPLSGQDRLTLFCLARR